MRSRFLLAAILTAGLTGGSVFGQPPSPAGFQKLVRPLLKKHCLECHSGDDPDVELELHAFRTAESVTGDRKTWGKVLTMLRGGRMPPKDEPRPPKADVQAAMAWLEGTLSYVDCTSADPGRVTIRRLNRIEYQNTIRDLLSVEFNATADFPADDVGYGFDNIGDVLSLSPILMEKYLAASERIAGKAITTATAEAAKTVRADGNDLKRSGSGGAVRDGGQMLYSAGQVTASFKVTLAGEYLIRTRAYGDQAGDEPARMQARIDGREVKTFDVKAIGDKPADYDHKLKLSAGTRRIAMAFVNDYYNPKDPDPRNRDRNLIVLSIELVGPLRVKPEDYPASHRRIFFVTPADKLTTAEAAEKIVGRLASRAFRRPATDREITRLLKLFHLRRKDGGNFEQGIQLALTAVITSPHFLFRFESDPPPNAKEQIRLLSEYELATRMSYFLWSSMPDKQLFEQAFQGTLRKNLESEVRRMLADPKAEALVENFAVQWLQLRNLPMSTPDKKLFPTFNERLRADMRSESTRFFAGIIREDRSVLELVDADYTYLNERLARHYGISGVSGNQFRKVALKGDAARRGGVITQAAVLTVTSNPTRTSPVKRGKWILENILGTPPPPPPPNVPQFKEDAKLAETASLRQRLEMHRSNPGCAVCHRDMDALGFALENFDAIGAWRSKDGKFDIDAAGELPGGAKFNGVADLKKLLRSVKKDSFVRCLTEKMLTYGLGRGVEFYDKCAVDKITAALAKKDHKFSTLVVEIIKSDPFQKRRGQGSRP
ncbi:MAG: DUF1592 domain-containing protein [Planctomycetes bacterium]|nr:DUF1592 domain-containing protein [Planctomycetota bacterium]